MSNMYVTEPATEGKVLLHTSFGDLDIELWPQQAPKACRNFVQLCLEGYYDNTIFHRIIKDFMVQGGDPTGTGTGGESVFGAPFVDEFHSRLKFSHRGLLAMANENAPNTNHSQFFFTLDACEFLTRKHTIFGKITGNTIFNLLSVNDVDADANDRPLAPPKLLRAEVLWNPFDDMVVRETVQRAPVESDAAKKKRARKATNDRKLLSFGDDHDAFNDDNDDEINSTTKKKKKKTKIMSSHDLLEDKKLQSQVDAEIVQKIAETGEKSDAKQAQNGENKVTAKKLDARAIMKAAIAAARAGRAADVQSEDNSDHVSLETATEEAAAEENTTAKKKKGKKDKANDDKDEYTRLREELKREKKAVAVLIGDKARELEREKAKSEVLTPLQQQRAKFLEKKKAASRSGRQQDTLKKLAQFKATLQVVHQEVSSKPDSDAPAEAYHGQVLEEDEGGKSEDDTVKDKSWMAAKLKFKKHIDDYTTIDTRLEKEQTKLDSGRGHNRDRGHHRRRDDSRRDHHDHHDHHDRSRRERSRSRERERRR